MPPHISATDGAPWICCVLVEDGMVKLMGIECGPYYYGCPVEWLDLVPSRGGDMEESWRALVRVKGSARPGPRGTSVAAARGGLFDGEGAQS